jgi:hypothetical protein
MVKVKVIGAVAFINPDGSYFVCHVGDVVELDEARAAPYIRNGTLEIVAKGPKPSDYSPSAPVKKRKAKA